MKLGKDKVLVRRAPAPETVGEGGLKIPDAARERPDFGEVVAVGPEVTSWEPGDKVVFPKWCGFQVVLPNDDTDYLVIFEDEIWLVP